MKTTTQMASMMALLLILAPQLSYGLEHWWVPTQQKTYRVRNTTSSNQLLWVSGIVKAYNDEAEVSYLLRPGEFVFISSSNSPFLHLKAETTSKFEILQDKQLVPQMPLASRYDLDVRDLPKNLRVFFINPTATEQVIAFESGGHKQEISLDAFSEKSLPISETATVLKASGQQRFLFFAQKNQTPDKMFFARPLIADNIEITNDGARYFEMKSGYDSETFVVRVTDPVLAEAMLAQIRNPSKILSAHVALGSKSWNYNTGSKQKLFRWAWHVDEVFGLRDVASQKCDGNPGYLEEYLYPWVQNGGVICFWGYKVSRELTP